jgi:hypothetical protein
MTVAWVGAGERWDDAALAVACRTCNAEIGKPCDWAVFKRGGGNFDRGLQSHAPRADYAERLGFRVVVELPIFSLPDQKTKAIP